MSRRSPARFPFACLVARVALIAVAASAPAAGLPPASLQLVGDWTVEVRCEDGTRTLRERLDVTPVTLISVIDEKHEALPVFAPKAGGWVKGAQLRAVRAQETTTPHLLDPASLVLRTAPGSGPDAAVLRRGEDFEADLVWGTVGRLREGRLGEAQPVWASYRFAPLRLDSVVLTEQGRIVYRPGSPAPAAPHPPALGTAERRLANLWIPGRVERLSSNHLFPILEAAYPETPAAAPSPAERFLPKTLARLRTGGHLRVLAWGDSVTDGGYLPQPGRDRWQEQFVSRLRARFPHARIELITEAWGGRNTGSYLAEPPGSPHNYREKVLGAQPHLVVSEFVNDAGLDVAGVQTHYARFREDFAAIGAEWILLTPHYVRPDWMGLDRERDIDDDPRPYVAGLRRFAATHGLALADASRRYGRLWRQGIPYTSLMLNSINHPDAAGMSLFADALMEVFPLP